MRSHEADRVQGLSQPVVRAKIRRAASERPCARAVAFKASRG